mgnify:CR=1 FL=1
MDGNVTIARPPELSPSPVEVDAILPWPEAFGIRVLLDEGEDLVDAGLCPPTTARRLGSEGAEESLELPLSRALFFRLFLDEEDPPEVDVDD